MEKLKSIQENIEDVISRLPEMQQYDIVTALGAINSRLKLLTNTHLRKIDVCQECLSPDIVFADTGCVCTLKRAYPIITLEFEVCSCCGNLKTGEPADTDFNYKQLESIGQ